MVNPPGGGDTSPEKIEAAIRALVVDAGPSVRKLVRNESDGSRVLMAAAVTPRSWSAEEKASAVLAMIAAVIEELTNQRWRRTAQATFRIPTERYRGNEFDTLMARWRALASDDADREGQSVDELTERYRGYWRNSIAPHLARAVHARLDELNRGDGIGEGWMRYRREESTYIPPAPLPMSFERQEVLYLFDGRRGIQCTSQRWLVAHGPVEYYEAVGWYYADPDANVEIVPVANCELDGPYQTLPQGGRTGRLRFSRTLSAGERYYFAYTTRFNSERDCRPTILNEVRGIQTDRLTVRAQFDRRVPPTRCWYFDVGVQSDGWQIPPDGAPQHLEVASNGYVEVEFMNCQHGRKYGLRWIWP